MARLPVDVGEPLLSPLFHVITGLLETGYKATATFLITERPERWKPSNKALGKASTGAREQAGAEPSLQVFTSLLL